MIQGGYRLLMGDGSVTRWESPPEAPPEQVDQSHGKIKQCIGTLIVSLTSLNCGLSMRWVSSTPLALVAGTYASNVSNSAFTDSINSSQYASFLAALLMGLTANCYGRKNALFLSCVVNLIGGGILRHPTNSNLWIGRVCLSCNIITALTIVPMYISEIAQKRIRGTLMLSSLLLVHLGALCSFALKETVSTQNYSTGFLIVTLVQLLLLTAIPETPYFLISKYRPLEAEGSLYWFRGSNRPVAKGELSSLIKASPKLQNSLWRTICSEGNKNALTVSIGLVFFKRLSGSVIFFCYSGLILHKSSDPFNSKHFALILSGIQAVAVLLSLLLIDVIGRKTLLYMSHVGSFIFLSIFTVYLMVERLNSPGESWLPLISLCGFIFSYGVGLSSMASVVSNEVTPIQVKGIVAVLDGVITSLLVLATIQCYPFLSERVGDYLNFLIPAIINAVGLVFTWAVVSETKGKTLHDMLFKMMGGNSNLEILKLEVTRL